MAMLHIDTESIDWPRLCLQKLEMLDFLGSATISPLTRLRFEGIINLIDAIQDAAVDAGVPESHVFGYEEWINDATS